MDRDASKVKESGRAAKPDPRRARQAEALRANLRRRKAQAAAREAGDDRSVKESEKA